MTVVAMMQPTFMPWQGYFELIMKADVFVFLDDFQFSYQSWQQRNKLFADHGRAGWYTAPVLKPHLQPLNRTLVAPDLWTVNLLKRLEQNYGKAPFFDEVWPVVSTWLDWKYESLAQMNMDFIVRVVRLFGNWDTEFCLSSNHPSELKRSKRVLQLLQAHDAEKYLAGRSAFQYMKFDGLFPVDDIDVVFQDYECKPYPQVGSDEFVPYLSVLDALFNVGVEGTLELVRGGTKHWTEWREMT